MSTFRTPASIVLLAFGTGCPAPPAPAAGPPDDCAAFDDLERDYESIARRLGAATWASYAGGVEPSAEVPEEPAAVRAAFGPLFERSAPILDRCAACRDAAAARRIEVWRSTATAWRLESSPTALALRADLERRVNEHVFERNGVRYSRADMNRLARSEDAAERRLVAELRADLHAAVVEDTSRLAAIRREAARAAGVADWGTGILAAQGLPAGILDPLVEAIETRTRDAWTSLLVRTREAAGIDAPPAPWDLRRLIDSLGDVPDDRWPKEAALPALHAVLSELGVDPGAMPVRRVEGDFGYGGQTIAVSIPDDVRMMLNPMPGSRTWGTLFHETGHALHAAFTRVESPLLKGYEWLAGASAPCWSEGMAQLLGQLVGHRAFLERHTDLSQAEIDLFLAAHRARMLLSARSGLADLALERSLYVEGTDPDAAERDVAGRYLGVDRPADARPGWAATAFLSAYPLYMQNYILADLVAAQIWEAVASRFGPGWADAPAVGAFFREHLWGPGESRPWTERVEAATGFGLSVEPYLRLLGIDG
jgi:hypothetical protein